MINKKLKEIVLLEIISDDIINLDNKGLNLSIWRIIDRYKKNYPLNVYYKSYNTIMQLFDIFKKNSIYCFKNEILEGCTNINCVKSTHHIEYLNPVIFYDKDLLSI